ncbi:MAG: hypothetical protein ABR525_08750 [Candidatus Limnocylindria bacterium]
MAAEAAGLEGHSEKVKSNDRPATAVFGDRGQAARAADDLRRAGFADEDIGFAMQQRTGMGATVSPGTDGSLEGQQGERTADVTSEAGGSSTVAVLAGLLGEAAAGLAPGVGPIFAGGTLSGLVTGSPTSTSGIAGGLVEAGMNEDEAKWHERAVERGGVVLMVKAAARHQEATATLQRAGGSCFEDRSDGDWAPREEPRG